MMVEWQTVPIGELFRLKQGTYLKPAEMAEEKTDAFPYPVYGANGVIGYSNRKMYLNRTTLISCRGANCGVVHYTVPNVWISNNSIACIPCTEIDPTFYYYVCLNTDFGDVITGSAQPQITITNLSSKQFIKPPLPIQKRIAGILSAYDELIENSQRRIEILEAMARALYREWFVHFRFPGHESISRVPSPLGDIPHGWEVKPFSGLATYVNGYAFKPDDWGKEGKPIIKIKELKVGVTADTPRNSGERISEKYKVRDGDVLFSWSADLDAYLWMNGEGLLNQHLFNVLPFKGISHAFCFHALKEAMPRFRALSLGATMHHIKRSALDQVSAVVAPEILRQQFDVLVGPVHEQLINLAKKVNNLRRARDLLLPRLLSGQTNLEGV